jgi:hypothetical protein
MTITSDRSQEHPNERSLNGLGNLKPSNINETKNTPDTPGAIPPATGNTNKGE